MRNDNDRNPKDFYGKTEAELRKDIATDVR